MHALIAHADQVVPKLLHCCCCNSGLCALRVMADQYGLFRFDNDSTLLSLQHDMSIFPDSLNDSAYLFHVKTPVIGPQCLKLLTRQVDTLRLNLRLICECCSDNLHLSWCNLVQDASVSTLFSVQLVPETDERPWSSQYRWTTGMDCAGCWLDQEATP